MTRLRVLLARLLSLLFRGRLDVRLDEEMQAHLGRNLARFIGLAELAGAVGLIAPLAMGILPQLTAIAAAARETASGRLRSDYRDKRPGGDRRPGARTA